MNSGHAPQDGLGSDDGNILGPLPPMPSPPAAGGHIQSYPAAPVPAAELPYLREHPAALVGEAEAPAAAAPVMPEPAAPTPAAAAAGVAPDGVAWPPPLQAGSAESSSSNDDAAAAAAPRVCQSAPITQGRSAVIAREYAKDRAVYVHRPRHAHEFESIQEDGDADAWGAKVAGPDGGSLPVNDRRGRGHVYVTPQRPSRDGAAAVVRGGEVHGEVDVAAQQSAAVAAAEEDARVRAHQRHAAFGYPT